VVRALRVSRRTRPKMSWTNCSIRCSIASVIVVDFVAHHLVWAKRPGWPQRSTTRTEAPR
jgi:hypothetical protein